MPTLSVQVLGIPKAQPRPRAFVRRTAAGPIARVYDAGTAEGWKSAIADALRDKRPAQPITGPVTISCRFSFPRPERLKRKSVTANPIPHVSKPDIDNLLKAVTDCLTAIGVWTDDALIQRATLAKWYCAAGELPGLEMRIEWDEAQAEARRSA